MNRKARRAAFAAEKIKRAQRRVGAFDFFPAQAIMPKGVTREHYINEILRLTPMYTREQAEREYDDLMCETIYKSSVYQVSVREHAPNGFGLDMKHLSIKRIDREVIHDWRDLQRIKNALVGPECEAIEIYPAESRLIDTANQYHLWCFTDPGVRIPTGFTGRRIVDDQSNTIGAKQRPFEPQPSQIDPQIDPMTHACRHGHKYSEPQECPRCIDDPDTSDQAVRS